MLKRLNMDSAIWLCAQNRVFLFILFLSTIHNIKPLSIEIP